MVIHTKRGSIVYAICWILATTLGWGVGLLQGQIKEIASPSDLARALLLLSLNGLLIGSVLGFLQWLVLRKLIRISIGWFFATLLGGLLSEGLGLILAIAIPWSILSLRGEISISQWRGWIFTPIPFYIIYSGFIIGLFQSYMLRRSIPGLESKSALLWVLGTWMGVGLGVFAGGWIRGLLLDSSVSSIVILLVWRMITGTVLGVTTASILFIILGSSNSLSLRQAAKSQQNPD